MSLWKNATVAFSSGALGGLVNAVVFWVVVTYGMAADLGVSFSVPSHLQSIGGLVSHQLIWGGIFAFLLLVPLWKESWFKRGLALGVVPSLVMLLYVFPYVTGGGMFGLKHGNMTFLVVFVANWIYSFVAAIWYKTFS